MIFFLKPTTNRRMLERQISNEKEIGPAHQKNSPAIIS
jgi:hypothetical protein